EGELIELKLRMKLLYELLRIHRSDAENDKGPHVPEDGAPQLDIDLVHELVRKDEPEAVLPELREHVHERERCEGLELVQVHEEWPPHFLRRVRSGKARQAEHRDEESAENHRRRFADLSFGEINDEDFAAVDRLPWIEGAFGDCEDAGDKGINEDAPKLVFYGGHRLGAVLAILLELGLPEALHLFILYALRGNLPKVFVVEEPRHIREGRFRLREDEAARGSEDVFEPHAPGVIEDFLQGLHDAVRGERAAEGWHLLERIEPEGLLRVGDVQIDEIRLAGFRHPRVEPLGKIAVWVKKSETVPGQHVLADETLEERGLARAGLPDHVHVGASIARPEAERPVHV